jgi:hypothetical protein
LAACKKPAPATPDLAHAVATPPARPAPPTGGGLALKVRGHDTGVLPIAAAWARRDPHNPTLGVYLMLDCDRPPPDPCALHLSTDGGLDAEPRRLRAACPKSRLVRLWFHEKGADRVHFATGSFGAHTQPLSVWVDVSGPEPSEDDEQLYPERAVEVEAFDDKAIRGTLSVASDDGNASIAGRFLARICE